MYVYYIDGENYITENYDEIPRYKISSPDENTPAFENLKNGQKIWCEKWCIYHRLTGPARFYSDEIYQFWLNGKSYVNVNDWLKDHPNQSNAFQIEMLLKYT
jgi:hypothetical protein